MPSSSGFEGLLIYLYALVGKEDLHENSQSCGYNPRNQKYFAIEKKARLKKKIMMGT